MACPAALLYAVTRSDLACRATASAECCAPLTRPGGKPLMAVPGLTPISPVMTDGPVLVIDSPARTAKASAVPRGTGVAMASAWVGVTATIAAATVAVSAAVSQPEMDRCRAMPRILSFIETISLGRRGPAGPLPIARKAFILSRADYA